MFTIVFKTDKSQHTFLQFEKFIRIYFWRHIPMQQLHMIDMAELMTYICSLKYEMGHNVGVLQ